jgi:branched-chain amino acid transport system ATP-binding protein
VLVQQLFGTLDTLKREGVTILLVEQNVHLALALSDYAYVLADGHIALDEGPAHEVDSMPEVRAAYLGL